MHHSSEKVIQALLNDLAACETFPPISLSFYHHIARLATYLEPDDDAYLGYVALLEIELRYHRELAALADRPVLSPQDLREPAERRNIGLAFVLEHCGRAATPGKDAATLTALLLAAAAHYLLRRTDRMIEAIAAAIDRGLRWPLLFLALGYGHYLLALERYAEPTSADDTLVLRDPISFQSECLQAAAILQQGLCESEWDERLYHWLGQVLEAAGLTDAAQDAYDKCSAPQERDDETDDLSEADPPHSATASDAITEEEVRLAGELFKGRFDESDILPDDSEDRN
jgi:hypothetical protein